MDELAAAMKAREFVAKAPQSAIPVSVESYAERISARIRYEGDLEPGEDGYSLELAGKRFICVNALSGTVRQRFTICHEIGHFVLQLASEHKGSPQWSYAKRPANEVLCDVFAAELLLPYRHFKADVEKSAVSFSSLDALAERFGASTMAAGSRFAALARFPCAYVISEGGIVRYASRSTSLREARAWIPPGTKLPEGSLSVSARLGRACDGPAECEADLWFAEWDRGGVLLEDARHLGKWDQTLTLLWFEDEEAPAPSRTDHDRESEDALTELDGVLPWPGKRHRK